ncbi:acyl carrier protein [Corynebacterium liangguodongii]|uniref:Acyl carrier protein n=1 Tax=Corynebacterium liangguodongii TaxID=2079535 RepID=A0A2S0WF71_9CORY|nr:acyl carrier protein [Corynebacterium liangguodongii]AWB84421.1 acyl carrier protein [Corynebacterium liangguodongii]PWB99911.1 acyl carrier protein [Corynebacterium liangguodongii]
MELSQRLNLEALVEENEQSFDARLAGLISRITGDEVDPGKTLVELGISSLDRIELAIRAEEEFGVRASEELYADNPTIAELGRRLSRCAD